MGLQPEEHLKIVQCVEDKGLGYRDFIYDPNEAVLICLLGDMNIVSRLDSYFTNFQLPWEKKEDN